MALEELIEAPVLFGIKPIGPAAQQSQPRSVPAEDGDELAGQAHQVQSHHAHGMEAVGDDQGSWEPAPHEAAVAVGQVDADDPHPLSAFEAREVARELGLAPAGAYVEDPPVLQVAKGRGEALALVERVLVDPQDERAVQAEPLPGLPLCKLGVDATYGRRRRALAAREHRGADPVIVALIDRLPPRLRAAPTGHKPRQPLHEAAPATQAPVAPAPDCQHRLQTEPRQMPRPPFIPALAVEAIASTARAVPRRFQRPMSPFFAKEP